MLERIFTVKNQIMALFINPVSKEPDWIMIIFCGLICIPLGWFVFWPFIQFIF